MGSKEIALYWGLVSSAGLILPCLFGCVYYAHLKASRFVEKEREMVTVLFGALVAAYGLTLAIAVPAPLVWELVRIKPNAVLLCLTAKEIWGWWRRGFAA